MSRKVAFQLAGSLLLLAVPALSQEFSADLVRQKPQNVAGTKVSVSGDKVRFEVTGQQKEASYAIINVAQRSSMMVLPGNKSYIVSPSGHLASSIPLVSHRRSRECLQGLGKGHAESRHLQEDRRRHLERP